MGAATAVVSVHKGPHGTRCTSLNETVCALSANRNIDESSRERVRYPVLALAMRKALTSCALAVRSYCVSRIRTRLSPIYDECCDFPSNVAPAIYHTHLRLGLLHQLAIAMSSLAI